MSVRKSGFSNREKSFVVMAWLPKATVQAAFGPVALDMVRKNGSDPEMVQLASTVLTVAVLSILITAPLGAELIVQTSSRLLTHDVDQMKDDELNNSCCSESK